MIDRLSWDDYFLNIAKQVATRSTCDRKHVGCVLVRDKTILSTGYNGSIRGLPHCDDVGHMMVNGSCKRTIHAEANAIVQAAKNGVAINGATAYITISPCMNCFALLVNGGINRIVYGSFYKDEAILELAKKLGIEMIERLKDE
jgi:dCMP deaminase